MHFLSEINFLIEQKYINKVVYATILGKGEK